MEARTFFYYHRLSQEIHAEQMSELVDLAICGSQPIQWYEFLKSRYQPPDEQRGPPKGFDKYHSQPEYEKLSGVKAQAALIDIFSKVKH